MLVVILPSRRAASHCCALSAAAAAAWRGPRTRTPRSNDQYRGRMEVTATPSRHGGGGGFDLRPDLALLDGTSGALQNLMTNRPPVSRTDELGLSGPFVLVEAYILGLVSVLRLKYDYYCYVRITVDVSTANPLAGCL